MTCTRISLCRNTQWKRNHLAVGIVVPRLMDGDDSVMPHVPQKLATEYHSSRRPHRQEICVRVGTSHATFPHTEHPTICCSEAWLLVQGVNYG